MCADRVPGPSFLPHTAQQGDFSRRGCGLHDGLPRAGRLLPIRLVLQPPGDHLSKLCLHTVSCACVFCFIIVQRLMCFQLSHVHTSFGKSSRSAGGIVTVSLLQYALHQQLDMRSCHHCFCCKDQCTALAPHGNQQQFFHCSRDHPFQVNLAQSTLALYLHVLHCITISALIVIYTEVPPFRHQIFTFSCHSFQQI